MNEIGGRLGLMTEWVDTDFDTIFTQLATGRFDVVASATTITAERAQQVGLHRALLQLAAGLHGQHRPDPRHQVGRRPGRRRLGRPCRPAPPVPTGPPRTWLRRASRCASSRGAADAYNAVEAGQVTGVVFDEPSAVAEVANRAGLAIVEAIDTNEHYGFGVDPARPSCWPRSNRLLPTCSPTAPTRRSTTPGSRPLRAACSTEPPAPAAIGTEENPIQVLFVPSVSAEEIIAGGESAGGGS